MREGEENEGLTLQTSLGKALNAKLRTTEFIMQNKTVERSNRIQGSKLYYTPGQTASWDGRREAEMLLP